MLRNRPTATLTAILAVAAWPSAALAASSSYSPLTSTAPPWLTSAPDGQATSTAPPSTTTTATVSSGLPATGSDLPLEALIATGLLAGGAVLRLRRSADRA
jgi:hypothetical protein